ncbi:MAG: LysR family transcriptional regulator [Pseudomonadota bacterium]
MSHPPLKGVSLKGLEVFEMLARTGSVAQTADALGLSRPAVSQQCKNLDEALGAQLLDHRTRPMQLTPAGRVFLRRVEKALAALRAGQRDLTALDLSGLSALRLGVIEDFENDVTPRLTERLAESMLHCSFRLRTAASHVLHDLLHRRGLDMAICAAIPQPPSYILSYPLLDDPYVLAVPRGTDVSCGLEGLAQMPFIRRDSDQLMGQQIDEYLATEGVKPPQRFELDSNQSISALVAGGVGWTISTHQSLMRAGRFAGQIEMHDLPGKQISRQIALYASDDWHSDLPGGIADLARDLIEQQVVASSVEVGIASTRKIKMLR